ncbi:type III polyketide synthase [Occultella gossypii]|uniref:Type III polyketide synthase n=1 Tax=Occultella gossypii TaxID=2800820 RepID=A0ABS7SAM5_9MICO|nr:3-oxoacyl-[acyl-carrier-protein] synthase III C-terminal domain-containing protein [Occultella gossypii]MBZ2196298.1 type III polyketide synthase [Occultella gossypii]
MSRLVAVGTALPGRAHPQQDIIDTIGPLLSADPARRAALARLQHSSGVRTRHLALPLEEYGALTSFGRANDLFISEGTTLAEQACRTALSRAGIEAVDVDFLLFTSVTGISAPSIDAALVGRLGLRSDVRRLPSFGLGCVAGAAGIARVHDYLVGHPEHVGLLVSVELCSLTFQRGDDSTANLVSSALFGDGAAAVVLVGRSHPAGRVGRRGPEVLGSRSCLYPGTADQLGWHIRDTGFAIMLSAGLPDVIAEHLAGDVATLLEEHTLAREDVTTWVVHAGGPRIFDAVAGALDLDDRDLQVSRDCFAAVGNLSSSSVLHVLADTLERNGPAPGSYGVLLAFGPGVCAELVLLRWEAEP